jgi:hypothetical protein
LGLVVEVGEYLNTEADALTVKWLTANRVAIKNLNDVRQDIYRQIREMSKEPQDVDVMPPRTWMVPTTVLEADGSETPLPVYNHHLMSDDGRGFPVELNQWEQKVLEKEMDTTGFEAWYRNPERASQDSLAIAYIESEEYKLMRPDFVFFARKPDGDLAVDIVDPHGIHLSDALPKLRGLAEYAEKHDVFYRRIESISEVDGKLRLLDLTNGLVRQAVLKSDDARALFRSEYAEDYLC